MTDIASSLADVKSEVERQLDRLLPAAASCPGRLGEAMRYSLLSPAKRVRGIITVLAAEHCGGDPRRALTPAASLEMVHAASLILDDLPAMDDAVMRRGRATSHRVFGEATAILAAIALMNEAFAAVASDHELSAAERSDLVVLLTASIGPGGLTGGQELDLKASRDGSSSLPDIERTHALKTGALFAAAARAGAIAAGAAEPIRDGMLAFGQSLGLAFQAYDDVLDAHAAADTIGKDVDRDGRKPTVVHLLGRTAAEARAGRHIGEALALLDRSAVNPTPSRLGRYVSNLVQQLTAPLASPAERAKP